MEVVKFFLGFVLAFVVAGELDLKPTKQVSTELMDPPKDRTATVISSNLPESEQKELADILESIYNSVSNPLKRATRFQKKLIEKYPNIYNNVFTNYAAAVYYQKYFIKIAIEGDVVLGFGL